MQHSRSGLMRPLTTGLLALAIAGCSSTAKTTAPTPPPNLEGNYAISGTYALATQSNVPNSGVFGSMQVTNQNGTSATDSIAFVLEYNGGVPVELDSIPTDTAAQNPTRCDHSVPFACVYAYGRLAPTQVTVGSDSSFSAVFTGKEVSWNQDPATCCTDVLTLTGKVSGNTISGDWVITISAPINGRDAGTFVAQR